jgi:phage FluMu protein Com
VRCARCKKLLTAAEKIAILQTPEEPWCNTCNEFLRDVEEIILADDSETYLDIEEE